MQINLWRISRHVELGGQGGIWSAGRWHLSGTPVVYLAETPAGALLDVCVHTSANDLPPSFTLLKVAGPEFLREAQRKSLCDAIELEKLSLNWTERLEETRQLGSEWLKSGRKPLLRVPSALVPETYNYLLNPLHRDAGLYGIEKIYGYPFDLRLKN